MKLNTLFNIFGSKKPRKRVGRGNASGTGRTCGKGEKGQKSRSGVAVKGASEQTSLIKRLPKRGFSCSKAKNYTPLNLMDIESLILMERIDINSKINKELLVNIGYIKSMKVPVKLLAGTETFNHKITVELDAYSAMAKSVIEKVGGEVITQSLS